MRATSPVDRFLCGSLTTTLLAPNIPDGDPKMGLREHCGQRGIRPDTHVGVPRAR
jgi:hypothetical protein